VILLIITIISVLFFIVLTIVEICYIFVRRSKRIINAENNTERATEMLIDHLSKMKREMIIATGYGNPEFYGQENVYKAFENALKQKDKRIYVISGKFPHSEKYKREDNPFCKLAKMYPNLYVRELQNTEYLQPHFRIIDNRDVWLESDHIKDCDKRTFSYYPNDLFLIRKLRKLYSKWLDKE